MIPVEEALERILARIGVLGDEQVALTRALHRVLAESAVAGVDVPPWPNSSMDGYALRSADTRRATTTAPVRLAVSGRVAAGHIATSAVGAGQTFRIFTGGPLPEGADCVIPQEDVTVDARAILVSRPVGQGDYVRPRGEDVRAGDLVLERGRLLGPADLGLLAALGRSQVRVVRRPRVGVLSTGDEIVDLGAAPGPGQISNSNTYSLMAQVEEAGGDPISLGVAADRLLDIEARLRWGLDCDLLISSAGVSVGEHDFVKAALGRSQVRVVRRPRVGILSTGDEIVDLGAAPGPGQISNSNTYSLMAQVEEAGGDPISLGVAADRLQDIEARLRWGLDCDLLISSAGVSVGEHDFVKAALERLGAEQHLWLVDMRPGKPIAFATIPSSGKHALPMFALPGNPVSTMVTFELFVRPALLRQGGHARIQRPVVQAQAEAPIANPGRRRGYLRVTLSAGGDGGYRARLTGGQSSGILRSMVAADGLAVVPGDTTVEAGATVPVILLRDVR